MEPDTGRRLSPRGRRAVALIAVSVLAIAVAGLAWIAPNLRPGNAAKSVNTVARPTPQTPSPAPFRPTAYSFISPSVGWAEVQLSPRGTTVFKTEDGGKRWRLLTVLAGDFVGKIQFVDTSHGFVTTSNPARLYRTTDGGTSWSPVVDIPHGYYVGVTFEDANHGWATAPAAGSSQTYVLHVTSDGGDHWAPLSALPPNAVGPFFRGSEIWLGVFGFAVGQVQVYTSVDRGLTWSPRAVPRPPGGKSDPANPPGFSTYVSLPPGKGVVVRVETGPGCEKTRETCAPYDVAEFTSFDGGSTWRYVPRPPGEYSDIAFASPMRWWSVDASGTLFMSPNNGQTWNPTPVQLPPGRHTFYFLDSLHAWLHASTSVVSGANPNQILGYVSMLMYTADGGLRWTRVTTPS